MAPVPLPLTVGPPAPSLPPPQLSPVVQALQGQASESLSGGPRGPSSRFTRGGERVGFQVRLLRRITDRKFREQTRQRPRRAQTEDALAGPGRASLAPGGWAGEAAATIDCFVYGRPVFIIALSVVCPRPAAPSPLLRALARCAGRAGMGHTCAGPGLGAKALRTLGPAAASVPTEAPDSGGVPGRGVGSRVCRALFLCLLLTREPQPGPCLWEH